MIYGVLDRYLSEKGVTQALHLSDALVMYSSRDNKSIFHDKTACYVSFNQNCVRDPVGGFND